MDPLKDAMIEAALDARSQAYAPYSRFLVGAAIRCERGLIHGGCNVENAAYPQGVCAEAGAISSMILSGSRRIVEVVIAGGGATACTPCGGCRQKIREFAGADVVIRMVDQTGHVLLTRTLDALLPDAFGPENLD